MLKDYDYKTRVSVDGYIESKDMRKKNPKFEPLTPSINGSGYATVRTGDGVDFVHRIVWRAFVGEIPDGMEINHKDEVKTNNSLDNLELISAGGNRIYNDRHKRVAHTQRENGHYERLAKTRSKAVVGINIETGDRIEFPSCAEAGRNGFDASAVAKCCNGKLKQYKTYRWYYK